MANTLHFWAVDDVNPLIGRDEYGVSKFSRNE
jgi:hypothetical protein